MGLSRTRRCSPPRGAARGVAWAIAWAHQEKALEHIIEPLQLVFDGHHALFHVRHTTLVYNDIGRRFAGFV